MSPGFLSRGSSSLTACQRFSGRSGITDVRRGAMDQPVTEGEHKDKVQDGDRQRKKKRAREGEREGGRGGQGNRNLTKQREEDGGQPVSLH